MIKLDQKRRLVVTAAITLSLALSLPTVGCDDAEEEADSDVDAGPEVGADFGSDGTPDSDGPTTFPPPGAQFVFAAIGDFGDTVDLSDDDTETLRVANLIVGWDPDFVVTVGDNDYSDAEFEGSFRGLELGVGQYFHEFIGNYQGSEGSGASENAFFPVPGDHDYGDDCDDPRLGDYLDYFTLPEGDEDETYYSVRRGPVELFAIDSVVDCHQDGGDKLNRQRAWLERVASASDATFKIAYFHHPPYSSGANHGSAEHMQWPFGDWGIQLVLSGDDHVYERIERDGVTYLVIGLGGVDIHDFGQPVAGSQVRYNGEYGALGVGVYSDRLDVAFVNVDGVLADAFAIRADGSGPGPVEGLDPNVPPLTNGSYYRPGITSTWHWQLQGELNTSYEVLVYDVDLFDTSESQIAALRSQGRHVVCYFSAGTYEDFRDDADEFESSDLGDSLEDFEDENWLDIRSSNVHRIMRQRLDLAQSKGCGGVEPDNVDGYTNDTGFPLTASDQLAFNRFIANEAHQRSLSVGLKNDLEQVEDLVDYFDFAVNEQCHEYDECELLEPFVGAGKAVFVAEYDDPYVNNAATRDAMCADSRAHNLRTLVLPWDLDDSFRYSCD